MKIGSVSEKTGLGIHTIRYYERQGLIKAASKDASGHRTYSMEDVEVLDWISCMKNSGMSLSKIKQYTQAFYRNDKTTCTSMLELHLTHLQQQQTDIAHYIKVTQDKINRFTTS